MEARYTRASPFYRVIQLIALTVICLCDIACQSRGPHVGLTEEHLFPNGDKLQCISWDDGDFGAHVLRCSFKDHLGTLDNQALEYFSRDPKDGPRSLASTKRMELFRDGASAAIILDDNVFSTWADIKNMSATDFPDLPKLNSQWHRWSLKDDKELPHLFSFVGQGTWLLYSISSLDLAQRKLVALRPGDNSSSLPRTLVVTRRGTNESWAFDVDQTLASNPGFHLPPLPSDLAFEIKVVESNQGKDVVRYRGSVNTSNTWQSASAEVLQASGERWKLDYAFRGLYWENGQLTFHMKVRQHDVFPLFTHLGEWRSLGSYSDLSHPGERLSPYIRLIRAGQLSAPDELPPVNATGLPMDVN